MVRSVLIAGFTAVLSACAPAMAPQSTASPALDSGITASSGGGTQTLGNTGVGRGVTTPAR